MEKQIVFFGHLAKVACDEKCNKAWGSNHRPKNQLSNNPDDFEWLSDNELGDAPVDPGTEEGSDRKPISDNQKGNRWCVRECERCAMSDIGDYDKPLSLPDFSKRITNINL